MVLPFIVFSVNSTSLVTSGLASALGHAGAGVSGAASAVVPARASAAIGASERENERARWRELIGDSVRNDHVVSPFCP
jgi:hypothetical protein